MVLIARNTGTFLTQTQTPTRTETPTQTHSSVFPASESNMQLFNAAQDKLQGQKGW